MSASGRELVEVGTTNRTRIGDYRAAVTERTGAVLKVHPQQLPRRGVHGDDPRRRNSPLASPASAVPFASTSDRDCSPQATGCRPTSRRGRGARRRRRPGDVLRRQAARGPQAGTRRSVAATWSRGSASIRSHARSAWTSCRSPRSNRSSRWSRAVRTTSCPSTACCANRPGRSASVRSDSPRALGGDLEHAHVHRCESVVGGGSMPGTAIASWGVATRRVPTRPPSPPGCGPAARRFCRVEDDAVCSTCER